MKRLILTIFLGFFMLSITSAAKKAEIKDVEGIIFFRYIFDKSLDGYCCRLTDKILIDGTMYDFFENSFRNYYLLKENQDLVSVLGVADKYKMDDISLWAFFYPERYKNKPFKYKQLMNRYSLLNIFDNHIYQETRNVIIIIKSNDICKIGSSDTLCIPIRFRGRVIKYDNVVFGQQTEDENIQTKCPSLSYDSSFVVLAKVRRLRNITDNERRLFNLRKSTETEIKLPIYE